MESREWRFAVTISGAHGMDHLLKRVFPPLIPVWVVAFGFPLWKLGVLLGAQTFGSAVGQAPMGHLSDRHDRRLMLPTGIALIGVAFLAFATVPSIAALEFEIALAGTTLTGEFAAMLAAMLAVGIGSSTLHPTGYPLISQNVSEERKGRVLGMWGSARAFGDAGAPALVGAALLVTGWRPIVAGFGLVGLAYAVYLFVALDGFETRPAGQVAEREGAESGGGDGNEEATDDDGSGPSLRDADRRLYVYPVAAVFVAFVLQLVATSGATVFLPEFLTSQYGYSFAVAGVAITPESTASFYYSALLVTAGIVQIGTGGLVDRYDSRKLLVGFLLAGTVALAILARVVLSPLALFPLLLLLGASLWGLNPARDAIVSEITPAEREGRTFGYLWTGGLLLASASPAVVGYIGDVASLRDGFLLLAGLVLLSAIPVALLLSDRVYLESGTAGRAGAD
ncbi:MAG: MFS transporter [Haloarculaceae archaeon]